MQTKQYLFRFPLNRIFARGERGVQPESTIQLFSVTLIILIACSALFVLFEKPFMRKDWPARTYKRLQAGFAFLSRLAWGRPAAEAFALENDER